jgi:hypothetical protein
MLQAHSPLWNYLWVAPSLLLLVLAGVMWKRRLQKQYPVFLIFAVMTAITQLTLYAADVIPSVSTVAFWRIAWAGLLVEAVIKFALIGEIFGFVFGRYPSVAKLGTLLIRGVGVALALLATVAAAYTKKDSTYWIISGAHLLEQTMYLIECGLILFLFIFAAYFKLRWNRSAFGIALGLGVSACVHLATWALMASAGLSVYQRNLLDFLNMGTYHVCVLIWFYYLLVPEKKVSRSGGPTPPEHNLEVWNQELERLLHQ